MRFADVEMNGIRYRGVQMAGYRPDSTYGAINSSDAQRAKGYSLGITYWFRFDPLRWRILNPYSGLMIAEKVSCNSAADIRQLFPLVFKFDV